MHRFVFTCRWTHCNQQCNQECWYTYISYYWHMPLNKYRCVMHIFIPPHYFCSIYRIHTEVKKSTTLIYHAIDHSHANNTYSPQLPHRKISSGPTMAKRQLCQYIFHMNSLKSSVTRNTGVHNFTLLAYAPEQIYQQHHKCLTNGYLLYTTYRLSITEK